MNRAPALGFIFITLCLDILGAGVVIPIMPKLIGQLAHGGISDASRDYGWLLSLYGLMQFLFSPILGSLSDRFGRRPVLLLSLLFTSLDYVVLAVAPSLPWIYAGRILSGITGASFTAGTAYIADVSPPEKRAQNFSLIGAAFGIGFILGPALGGLLGHLSLRAPFWASAALAFANMLYGLFVLPESLAPENRRRFSWREANPVGALGLLSKYPLVWSLTGSFAATALAMQCLQSTWVLYTTARFRWDVEENGLALGAFGAVALVFQAGLSRVLLPRWGERRAATEGLVIAAFEYLGYSLITKGWMVYLILALAGPSYLAGPATQAVISRQVSEDEQGGVQGALASLTSLMGIIGPLIATGLFGIFTGPHRPFFWPGSPMFLGFLLEVAALIVTARAFARLPVA